MFLKEQPGMLQFFPPKWKPGQILPMLVRNPQPAWAPQQCGQTQVGKRDPTGWLLLLLCPQAGVTGAGWQVHQAPWGAPGLSLPSPSCKVSHIYTWGCLHNIAFCAAVVVVWPNGAAETAQVAEGAPSPAGPSPWPICTHAGTRWSGSSRAFLLCGMVSQLLENDCLLRALILQLLEASGLC